MEEVLAKSARTLYVVTYSICIFLSVFVAGVGILFTSVVDEDEAIIFGWVFIVLGIILLVASIAWLVYFIKMPKNAITLKDGKLHFRNGIVCSPTEVDNCIAKTMGLDGAIFSFGKLIVTVNGKQFKLKFVDQANAVSNRLYMLKAEYSVKENIIKNQQTAEQQSVKAEEQIQNEQLVQTEEQTQEDNNG